MITVAQDITTENKNSYRSAQILGFKQQLPKPFLKWVGGKSQLLPEIHARLPNAINVYIEPFIGGGAMMWSLPHSNINHIVISDYNRDLINTYRMVKENPKDLIESLQDYENDEDFYYRVRGLDRLPNFDGRPPIERAARFIYLNKTGYNGLYRVNSKGQHNVPFGRYKNPNIVDAVNIHACSATLQDITILSGDFEVVRPYVKPGAFIYLDPPYVPVSDTSSFTSYTAEKFADDMQVRLRDFCDFIDSAGAKFMLSNSDSGLIHDLYKNYRIDVVMANRAINCKANGRGKVKEVLVMNYN